MNDNRKYIALYISLPCTFNHYTANNRRANIKYILILFYILPIPWKLFNIRRLEYAMKVHKKAWFLPLTLSHVSNFMISRIFRNNQTPSTTDSETHKRFFFFHFKNSE